MNIHQTYYLSHSIQSMGNGPISMSAAAVEPTTAMDAAAPDAAPQFFNPNQFAGTAPVGTTKRNKYH